MSPKGPKCQDHKRTKYKRHDNQTCAILTARHVVKPLSPAEKSSDMKITLPNPGFVFWPVGTGDSTTICLNEEKIMQVDIHHVKLAGDEEDPRVPVVDALIPLLPQVDGIPYLACFGLTHPDKDHVKGFSKLLEAATIGELWFSPRIFWEFHEGDPASWCEDAKAFYDEAERRVTLALEMKEGEVLAAGDRVRIIGNADVIRDYYSGFPRDLITVPGNELTEIDGDDCSDVFRAFIHSPFKDDCSAARNETSMGMQVTLKNGNGDGKALLLGDLSYATLCKVFRKELDGEKDPNVYWDLYLATHHCSKYAMYLRKDGEDVKQQDILDAITTSGGEIGYIVLSCDGVPSRNSDGDNPPHKKARNRYEEIAPSRVICTMEEPSKDKPEPIIFDITDEGMFQRVRESGASKTYAQIAAVASGTSSSAQPRSFGSK